MQQLIDQIIALTTQPEPDRATRRQVLDLYNTLRKEHPEEVVHSALVANIPAEQWDAVWLCFWSFLDF